MPDRTPLYQWHREHGARMVEFAGYEMPIQYTGGALEEHRLVRRSAGLFDVSHMGQFQIQGSGALAYLDRLVSSPVQTVEAGQSTYGLICLPSGGVVDDVFLYRRADHWLMVVNAANRRKDLEWCRRHLPASGVEVADISDTLAMLALQGPNSLAIADSITNGRASAIPRFGAASVPLETGASGETATVDIGRTGYTGEDGVELFVPAEAAERVWIAILQAAEDQRVECGPVGLAARDSLRFEPGFALYGHELTEDITPLEARLKWACDFDTPFIGKEALIAQQDAGLTRRLATVVMQDKGVPREGFAVYSDGNEVGHVATGLYAPTVDAYCANVFVAPSLAKTGKEVDIEIRGSLKRAKVVKRPLYTPSYR